MGGEIEKTPLHAVHVTLDSPDLPCLNDFVYTANVPVVRTWALPISLLSRLGYTFVHPCHILRLGDFAGPGHLPRQVTILYAGVRAWMCSIDMSTFFRGAFTKVLSTFFFSHTLTFFVREHV